MKKTLIALILLAVLVIAMVACGKSTGAPAIVEPATERTTLATISKLCAESMAIADAESETAAATVSFSAGETSSTLETAAATTTKAATSAATQSSTARASTTTTTNARLVTATQTTTTTRPASSATTATPKTQPPKTVYTEADYAEIIATVRAYAESKTLPFIWDTMLTYEYARSGMAGYHDVVELNLNGKDGVIKTLKYNVDLTVDAVTNPMYGVPSSQVHYNVVKIDYQGEPYFALIYG